MTSGWIQGRTKYFHYQKYWKEIAPYWVNDIFMPSLNNYNTIRRWNWIYHSLEQVKDKKLCHFLLRKIWNMLRSKIKAATTTASFTDTLKIEILKTCSSNNFYWLLLTDDYFLFYYLFWVHTSRETQIEINHCTFWLKTFFHYDAVNTSSQTICSFFEL